MADSGASVVHVPVGRDRFGLDRKVFGVMPFAVKVAARDTSGGMLVIEQANDYRGGPPRHVHFEQDEWFYAVEGTYVVEVAGVAHRLAPGDSVLAPRGVPHGWALVDGPGRMIIAFHPAGSMEAFFDRACELASLPPHEDVRSLFAEHGMRVEGPPVSADGV